MLVVEDDRVHVLDPERVRRVGMLEHPDLDDVSLIGDRIANWSERVVRVWRASDGELLAELPSVSVVRHAVPIPGVDQVAIAILNATVELVDTMANRPVAPPLQLNEEPRHVAFDPTERALVFAADGTVHALVPGTGAAEILLDGGPETVKLVEVSPDGSRLVTVRDSEVEIRGLAALP